MTTDARECSDEILNVVEVRASSLTPEQCERYEDDAMAYMRVHPFASDDELLEIMDRVQAG
ncbi:hypothetical protein [Brachybacterium tyrofermentans]|uniref:hypothetical protein n=1 Tax=Brachybacterium tyrofermentans TaxID=47848 RepID=UPI001867DB6A|nr:hypothetical protein [Brachybacterium tyrofermentans]